MNWMTFFTVLAQVFLGTVAGIVLLFITAAAVSVILEKVGRK